MRHLKYSVAASLDGFIADPRGGYDWIVMDPAVDFAAMFRSVDTFVMGRKTWEVSVGVDPSTMGSGEGTMFAGKDVIVFTRTPKPSRDPHVAFTDASPVETVRALKDRPGKDIWLFGGGEIFRTLVDAGLVDTIEVGLMPVLLSEGVPILPPGVQIRNLTLQKCEPLTTSGIVMLTYTLGGATSVR